MWGIRLRTNNNREELSSLDAFLIPFGATTHDLASKTMFDGEAQGSVFSAPSAFK